MSTFAIIAGLILAAQVGNAGGADRYGTPPVSPAPAVAPPSTVSPLGTTNTPPAAAAPPSQYPLTVPNKNTTPNASTTPFNRPNQAPFSPGASVVVPPSARSSASGQPQSSYPWQQNSASTSPLVNDPNSTLKPTGMMRAMLTPPSDSRLPGEPVSLDEIVVGASSRADQTQRIEAYWDLCASITDYYLGMRELHELKRLRNAGGSITSQMEAEIAVRIGTAQKGALASQYRLASLIGHSGNLPLPADIPHCSDYQCRYDEIFSGRSSPEGQELSQLIPLRYTELKDAAAAVKRAEDGFDSVVAGRGGGVDEASVVRALELLAMRRRAFVQIARDYNRRIARYCELAAPGQVETNRLVGMLIRRNGTATATRPSLLSPPPNRHTQVGPDSKPLTFAEGAPGWSTTEETATLEKGRDDEVKPASAVEIEESAPRHEKSLLVTPPH